MIELLLAGTYLGIPHEVGAWAYALRRGEELLAARRGCGRPQIITSRLSTEAAALTLALEEIANDWAGEEVVARTTSAGLHGLLLRQGKGVPGELKSWYARAREAAGRCGVVRVLPASAGDVAALRGGAQELLPQPPAGPQIARASALDLSRGRRI